MSADQELQEFYAESYGRLVAVLALTCGNTQDAEEVVQDAFLKLMSKWAQVRLYDDPEGWVRLVAFRLWVSRWRRSKTAVKYLFRSSRREAYEQSFDDRIDVERLLRQLSMEHRQVLILFHGLQLSVNEIADELGLPVGTVKSRLGRARQAARDIQGEYR